MRFPHQPGSPSSTDYVDVVLIGGGIVSTTLGAMLATLAPELRVVTLERADELACESSDPWNNAGTGHAGYCELNYMPDPADGTTAAAISRQFHLSRQWWAHLARTDALDPTTFIRTVAHLNVVFGDHDIAYLRRRFETLSADPLFAGMEFTDDPATVMGWAPLVMEGRAPGDMMAATRHPGGTDVDFGALTRDLTSIMVDGGHDIRLGHEVRRLTQQRDGRWIIDGRIGVSRRRFRLGARFVMVGAGGMALRLLQRAGVREVRGYGVLPVGAAFLRCSDPDVVSRHDAKVYGQAAIGAPPMSVPHLDRRVVDGRAHLLFGPYATFSTRLLRRGSVTDFFSTLTWRNAPVLAAAGAQNLGLLTYLITQLTASDRSKFAELQRFHPLADSDRWKLVAAGQRAQLVTPDRRRVGVLKSGTELAVTRDRSMAGLLGASPGASTAVPIMLDLLERCFPEEWNTSWRAHLDRAIPGRAAPQPWTASTVRASRQASAEALHLIE